METNLTAKHLGYAGLVTTLGFAGLGVWMDPNVVTAGFIAFVAAIAAPFALMVWAGRRMDRTRHRWQVTEFGEHDARRIAAMELVERDRDGAARMLDRDLRRATRAPYVLSALIWLVLPLLALSLVGVWTAIFAIPWARALWRRLSAYREGIREAAKDFAEDSVLLEPGELPQLRELVQQHAASLAVDPPDEVRVCAAPTAFVFERPERVGGTHARVLVVGLPFLQVLSTRQVSSIVAHELAHLANDDVSRTRRAAVARSRLEHINEAMDRRGIEPWLFRSILLWSRDRIDPLMFAFAREGELHADSSSARVLGAEAAAGALIHSNVLLIDRERSLHEFMARHAADASEPPPGFVRHMVDTARRRFEPRRLRARVLHELCEATTIDDPHPALADRVAVAGAPVDFSGEGFADRIDALVQASAGEAAADPAATWLDDADGERIIERADAAWRAAVADSWEELRFYWNDRIARIERQEADVDRGVRTGWLAYERAQIVQLTDGDEAALPWLEEAVELAPEEPAFAYALGSCLFACGLPGAEEHLIRSYTVDPSLVPWALPKLAALRYLDDDPAGGDQYRQAFGERREVVFRAHDERSTSHASTTFEPVKLDAARERRLVDLLWQLEPVTKAYLAQVPMELLPDEPSFAIALEFAAGTHMHDQAGCARTVYEFLSSTLRGVEAVVVHFTDDLQHRQIKSQQDALVFTRISSSDFQRFAA